MAFMASVRAIHPPSCSLKVRVPVLTMPIANSISAIVRIVVRVCCISYSKLACFLLSSPFCRKRSRLLPVLPSDFNALSPCCLGFPSLPLSGMWQHCCPWVWTCSVHAFPVARKAEPTGLSLAQCGCVFCSTRGCQWRGSRCRRSHAAIAGEGIPLQHCGPELVLLASLFGFRTLHPD